MRASTPSVPPAPRPRPGPEPLAAAGPEAASDHLIPDPLSLRDGVLHASLCGRELPLTMGGQPLRSFLPGWRAGALFTGFAPLFLLELVHDDGGRATWFLDYRLSHVGDSVATLPAELQDLLRLHAVPLLRRLTGQLLDRCSPVLDPQVRAFLGVNQATRVAIGAACMDRLVHRPALYLAQDLAPHSLLFRGEDDRLRSIDRDHLAAGLAVHWQDRIAGFVRDGRMSWPSPVDGTVLHAQGGLVFDDFHFAYRFADPRHGLVFYVLVGEHLSAAAGVWFPSMGLLVSHDETQRRLCHALLRSLVVWFVLHPLAWADELVPYLAKGATRFASVMRGPPSIHIGHQLWNELSGIDRAVSDAPDALPDWIVLNGDAAAGELYGPIDALYPELAGRVRRDLPDVESMTRWAYRDGVFVLRVTRELVSAGLRRRIVGWADRTAQGRLVAEALPASRTAPVLLVGLRVENRTAIDLPGFLTRLVAFVAERHPGSVLVFDGHNAATEAEGGGVIDSHGERFAGRRPIDVERELVAALRAEFAGRPVTIIDTIGRPISASLAWAAASDGFVSIWGASLAKYRWVCNKPGYVISSRMNLMHRGDLHIYDAPRYMQDPAPITFADPDLITDLPDAPQLVPVAPGDWGLFNFRIDEAGMMPDIGAFIDRCMAR